MPDAATRERRDFSTHLPATRWRNGARDAEARRAHNAATVEWRRSLADVAFPPEDRDELLGLLGAGTRLPAAAAAIGMTVNAVYGRCRWDVDFAERLETVLAETCPAGDRCGRPAGVQHGGHCADCRRAHHPPRQSRGRRSAAVTRG